MVVTAITDEAAVCGRAWLPALAERRYFGAIEIGCRGRATLLNEHPTTGFDTRSALRPAGRKPLVAHRVLSMLDSLGFLISRSGFTQLDHAVQTATRAERAGQDDEVVITALCHDIGKAVSGPNHAAISAEILRPYVRPACYSAVLAHRDLQKDYHSPDRQADVLAQYSAEPWFDLAVALSDDWDRPSADPDYESFPLEHFTSRVYLIFREPRYFPGPGETW